MSPFIHHPIGKIGILAAYVLAGIFVAQFFTLLLLFPIMGAEVLKLGEYIQHPHSYPGFQTLLLCMQGFSSFISMVVAPYFFIKNHYNTGKIHVIHHQPEQIFFLATVLLVLFAMPAIAYVAEWNQKITLPDYFQGVYAWALEKEESLKQLTEFITNFDSVYGFFLGLLVIALIPAFAEELLFRGCLQNLLKDYTKNVHIAVWMSAMVFSAIHLQFFGFFPRMLLGALFGYLYVWTGSLLIPVTGHFINNGFTLFLLYMKNLGALKMDVESTQDIPLTMVLSSTAIFAALLIFFYIEVNRKKPKRSFQNTLDNHFTTRQMPQQENE